MERFVTDLVKKVCTSLLTSGKLFTWNSFYLTSVHRVQSLQDVTGAEFKLFMEFLKNFKLFGNGASPENIRELIEIIEAQADLDAQFNVSDVTLVYNLLSALILSADLLYVIINLKKSPLF